MVELRLNQLEAKMKGHVLQGSPSLSFCKFNTDSRLSEPGELFFALIAERNGHAFISKAAEKGAAGAVISQKVVSPRKGFGLIKVEDTLDALQNLAADVLTEYQVKVVGITGSIGKTTTKEFAATLLAPYFRVLKSEGNLNNHIGLPLSVLKLQENHDIAILEMGMNHAGEIRNLTRIAPPQIVLITNIQPVHLEFFEDMAGIAAAKKEILEGAEQGSTAVLNGDDPWVERISKDWSGEKVFFGLSDRCDVSAKNIRIKGWEGMSFILSYGEIRQRISLPFFYETALYNYLAAVALGYAFSIPLNGICEQTHSLELYKMRGTLIHLDGGMILIDDSYNSNPAGLESTLKSVAGLPHKRKVAVLGDMLELGKDSAMYHRKAGEQVFNYAYELLVTVGALSRVMAEAAIDSGMPQKQVYSFSNTEEAADNIQELLESGDLILVKGSRGLKMENIVANLKKRRA
ncbi:MAG: UDP-N-acetylmuramoyl-tripeptide--D-alanyl-D-alanine ligase [Candidatus Aminicenantes bacterium]|nr:UDP-N-acetylmuramoyl-tripeptide--D-alanyl-D-alanine ligase [Candidatus Aminicenantes bacterium]